MKKIKACSVGLALIVTLTACSAMPTESVPQPAEELVTQTAEIVLSDGEITCSGAVLEENPEHDVYLGHDIVYYEQDKDFTYGEGTEDDAHSAEEAAGHTVVHITKPGTYSLSGTLSKGQIAVDLGEGAEDDPEAVVTLILDGVDITCEVAPAVIFYNVYECGTADADTATKDVDTSCAGANVIVADGTVNTVNGSYVARIYKPDSVVLNDDGTEVADAKKLHKYDAAFYSKMSMNIDGENVGDGVLNIDAENEGLDSELHLTINGGIINIASGNDGINTNEDGVSVTTVNGGEVHILVTGETGEGDGIDSNGWLVINGGTVTAQACAFSGDAGIDSDMGIHINGGTVIASGHMLDRIEDGGQNYAVFTFAEKQSGGAPLCMKDESENTVFEICPENDYSILVCSSPDLTVGTYTLWSGETQMLGRSGGMMGRPMMPEGMEMPDGMEPPEGMQLPPELPEGMEVPQGGKPLERPEPPEGMQMPKEGEDGHWKRGERQDELQQPLSKEFVIAENGNMFRDIAPAV